MPVIDFPAVAMVKADAPARDHAPVMVNAAA